MGMGIPMGMGFPLEFHENRSSFWANGNNARHANGIGTVKESPVFCITTYSDS